MRRSDLRPGIAPTCSGTPERVDPCSGRIGDKSATAEEALRAIGQQLDRGVYPRVMCGGLVAPNDSAVPYDDGRETQHVCAKSGSEAGAEGARARAPSSGEASSPPPRRSWPPSATASLVGGSLAARYQAEVERLPAFYPGARVWVQEQGLWLLTGSALLPASSSDATFLTGISYSVPAIRSWGFWGSPNFPVTWIGPRHTNCPDGSVCAFDSIDGTWCLGDPLVDLLDLYSLWALRHLHLRLFGRWPGLQSVPFPFERRAELKDDELCGCGESHLTYGKCCQTKDMAEAPIVSSIRYSISFGLRRPPDAILRFVREQVRPPALEQYIEAQPAPLFLARSPLPSRRARH